VDCQEFDGQVVRLDGIKELADKFVRVRLPRVDNLDLNVFEFDYDVTLMVFFLDERDRVYARYGGRDAKGADSRHSLAGLRYTMESVLALHQRRQEAVDADDRLDFAPKSQESPKYLRDGGARSFARGCLHCHQVKEALNGEVRRAGKWDRESIFRYPLPENLGLTLELDRGNVVKSVAEKTPAAAAGLQAGDVLRRLNGVPIHSFGDAQFALDRAPRTGPIDIAWQRDGKPRQDKLELPAGWRRTEVAWRASMRGLLPYPRVGGKDLTADEKKALGLSLTQLAFRQRDFVSSVLKATGIRSGDVVLGFDGKHLEMTAEEFTRYVQNNYLVGDKVTIDVLRDGKRHEFSMTLQR
jgi:predicted metalloprotease with PDZ domain